MSEFTAGESGVILTNSDTQWKGEKQFSAACQRNREPILRVLRRVLTTASTVLEIGSGSGQHAIYFARHLPQVTWYTSDLAENHASIRAWLAEADLPNVRPPRRLNVDEAPWSLPEQGLAISCVDAAFSANTLHIFSWPQVENFFAGVGKILNPHGHLCVYGAFKIDGAFATAADARFDAYLQAKSPASGLRDIAQLDELASRQGLRLVDDCPMPANNRLLVWQKEQTHS